MSSLREHAWDRRPSWPEGNDHARRCGGCPWPWLANGLWPWIVNLQRYRDVTQAAPALWAGFEPDAEEHLLNRLTAIRAAAEILIAHPDLPAADRSSFLAVIEEETDRLGRAIHGDMSRHRALAV